MHKYVPPNTSRPSHVRDLVLLFSVPVAITLLAAAVVYIPRLLANPTYDFIYSYCEDYDCHGSYSIDTSGQLLYSPQKRDSLEFREIPETRLGYFDAATGASRKINQQEARQYALINSSKSPDGYSLVHDEGGGGFLFWDDYDYTWQLENGAKKERVQLYGDANYYSRNINFIGWVRK